MLLTYQNMLTLIKLTVTLVLASILIITRTINRPSTDHQLQPSPATPPHLQKRKTQSATGEEPPLVGGGGGGGVEKPEGPSALQPTTESVKWCFCFDHRDIVTEIIYRPDNGKVDIYLLRLYPHYHKIKYI